MILTAKFSLLAAALSEKPMVVVTTSHNNGVWVKPNIESILKQKYSNFRVVYIDDYSQDGTPNEVEKLVKSLGEEKRFTLVRKNKRVGSLANLYCAIQDCKDEEIVVNVDGDDWLAHEYVLKMINEYYTSSDVWLTHGSLVEYPQGNIALNTPIPPAIVSQNLFRTFKCPFHLRTFYAWLFKKINVEDLMYEGNFFSMAWDQAIMYPMIEMAAERHAFIPNLVYIHNLANPVNDHKTNPQLKRNLEEIIRSKPPYERLEKSPLELDQTAP